MTTFFNHPTSKAFVSVPCVDRSGPEYLSPLPEMEVSLSLPLIFGKYAYVGAGAWVWKRLSRRDVPSACEQQNVS